MPAIEVRASIFWARLSWRGSESMASTVACFAASAFIRSGFCAGQMNDTSMPPVFMRPTSSGVGGRSLKTISDFAHSAAAPPTTSAPAAR